MKIIKKFQGTVPDNKILDTYSTSQTDTYSCAYANDKLAVNYVCASYSSNVTLSQEWQRPSLNVGNTYGNKLELKNGSVYVKSGVSKVKVSATVFFENMNSSHVSYIWTFINKNNGELINTITSGQAVYFVTVNSSSIIVPVQEGDYFNLNLNNPSYQNGNYPYVRGGINNTRLTVEVVE